MRARWRVRVDVTDYGRVGVVHITRRRFDRFHQRGLQVARIRLDADDADEQIADARAKAWSMAQQLDSMERARL